MPALPPYPINFTDQNPSKTVTLQDGKYYGSDYPTSQTVPLDAAGSSNTSLTLYGRNTPRYGERIQENMVYMLENFAGDKEPAFPVSGQLWFDRSGSGQLRVFNANRFTILSSFLVSTTTSSAKFQVTFSATALEYARLQTLVGKKIFIHSPGAVYNPLTPPVSPEIYVQATINPGGVSFVDPIMTVTMDVFNPALANITGWFIGGWESILHGSSSHDWFDALNARIQNLASPSLGTDAANKSYVDTSITTALGPFITSASATAQFVDVNGDTMTGFLTLHADPTSALHAATKQYVDAHTFNPLNYYDIPTSNATFVSLAGSTMTGLLTLSADPVGPLHAATKQYVDSFVGAISSLASLSDVNVSSAASGDILQYTGIFWQNISSSSFFTASIKPVADTHYVSLAGSSMSGLLTLSADPTAALHAATKQYVDSEIATAVTPFITTTAASSQFVDVSGDTMTGQLTLSSDPVVGLHAATKQYVDSGIAAALNNFRAPLNRAVFVTAASATTYDISLIEPGFFFTTGYNRLAVYANGLKLVASKKASVDVTLTGSIVGTTPTGLTNDSTVYHFNLTENGGSSTVIGVTGSLCQTYDLLVNEINLAITAASLSTQCRLISNGFVFYSAIGGTTSAVTIDIIASINPLFSSLTPSVSGGPSWSSAPVATDYNYYEAGVFGEVNATIVFHVAPANGTIIEAISNYEI
jgi:hypothetical protein